MADELSACLSNAKAVTAKAMQCVLCQMAAFLRHLFPVSASLWRCGDCDKDLVLCACQQFHILTRAPMLRAIDVQ